jgi:hypothetical protein
MFDGTPEQYLYVTDAILSRKDLRLEEKAIFLRSLLNVINKNFSAPSSSLPQLELAISNLKRCGLIKSHKVSEGVVLLKIDFRHKVFVPVKRKITLSNFTEGVLKRLGVSEIEEMWRDQFFQQFKEQPKRDPKDLIRFRAIGKKRSKEEVEDLISQYVYKHRNHKEKCTSLGLFKSSQRL